MLGYTKIVVDNLEKQLSKLSPLEIAREEANLIKTSYKKIPKNRKLRLHVSGDSMTVKGTRLLNNAIKYWKNNGGGTVWSYTHAWKKVKRSDWSNVSILASIDKIEDAKAAKAAGYAPAIVVDEFKSKKAFYISGSDIKWIPCPNQTSNITCIKCKLCLNADSLYSRNAGIAFAAHSANANSIKKRLKVINDK